MTGIEQAFGVVGLGNMGGNLALQALEKGFPVAGFARGKASEELVRAGLVEAPTLTDLCAHLSPPRRIFLYIPAGPAVDEVIDDLTRSLNPGDVLVDGGNSYWGDSIRRYRKLRENNVHFVDLGTSGGVIGARHGACFMAGGEKEAVERVEPILRALGAKEGYVHAGPPGTGHFTKLVHNGIEFGMLEAIAEGIDLLEHYHERLDIAAVLRCWRNGSVIRSWLIDLMEEAYRDEHGLSSIPAYVEDTGEVNWLVTDAIEMEVSVPVISLATMRLLASRDKNNNWARAIAMMRRGFGGHPYGADKAIVRERRTGRVGDFFRKEQG